MRHVISLFVFLPFLGAVLQILIGGGSGALKPARAIAFAASSLSSLLALVMVALLHSQPEPQMVEALPWVGSYSIGYEMAVDGLSALLVLLVALLFPVLIAAEWGQKTGAQGMYGLLLLLQTSLFGAVCAQDLFLAFFFWSLSAVPLYFLIGIWGGEKRESAAFRSIVSASLGNALLFAALVLIYYSVDPHSFSLQELSGGKLAGKTFELFGHELAIHSVAFALICLGLALRVPIWPLHGWFTHVADEAPSSVFVAIAAATVPVGLYLFVRLGYALFPETLVAHSAWIVGVGGANLVIGALCACAQKDLRRLLAFVCVSEAGLVLVGLGSLDPAGVVGAVYQQLILGLGIAGFGLFAGLVMDRVGHASFAESKLGGLSLRAPFVAVVAGVVVASLIGLPGSGGFVGRSLLVLGGYSVHPLAVVVAGSVGLLAAYYLFAMYRQVFLGPVSAATESFRDLGWREKAYLLPIVLGLVAFGIYPKPLLELVRPTVLTLLSTVKP